MSAIQTMTTTAPAEQAAALADPDKTPNGSFTAIVHAALDTARSSGSLESNASSAAASSQSVPSLDTSHSTASTTSSSSTSYASAHSDSGTPPGKRKYGSSPCPSILRSNSAPPHAFPGIAPGAGDSAASSASSSPNVTFAPLPQIEPRKRQSSHPLGVAARSRLLRHRRMLRERGMNPDDQYQYQYQYQYGPGSGVAGGKGYPADGDGMDDADGAGFPEVRVGGGDEDAGRRGRARTASDATAEDPLVSLGKLVKGAGKTLWRSLSMRDMRAKEPAAAAPAAGGELKGVGQEEEEEERGGSVREAQAGPPRARAVHLFAGHTGDRPVSVAEEGGVWEEELSEESWKQLLSHPVEEPDAGDGHAEPDAHPRESVDSTASAHRRRTSTVTAGAAHVSATKVR